MHSSLIVDII